MAHSKIFLGHNHHGTRAVVSKPTSCKLRHNYPGNFADGLKVKGRLIIPDETTAIDNVVVQKHDVLGRPVSYGGWSKIVQADKKNNISLDLFGLNDLDNIKFSSSEIIESCQQDSSEYFTNSMKEKQNTSPVDVKRKR